MAVTPSCAGIVFPALGVSQFLTDKSFSVPLLSVIQSQKFSLYQMHSDADQGTPER